MQLWCTIGSAKFGVSDLEYCFGSLLCNSFYGHSGDDMKRILIELNTDMAVIPGTLMSVLQPFGMSVNKDSVRKLCTQ
jgi:hypothetical protein